jgi:hypothetical protein
VQQLKVGDPELHPLKVENLCANLCAAQMDNCHAFFIVNEEASLPLTRTIGYGWRKPDVSTYKRSNGFTVVIVWVTISYTNG